MSILGSEGLIRSLKLGIAGSPEASRVVKTSCFATCYYVALLMEPARGVGGEFVAYCAAVRGVYPIDEVHSEVVLVWLPRNDGMAVLLESGNYSLDAAEDGRVRSHLKVNTVRQWLVHRCSLVEDT